MPNFTHLLFVCSNRRDPNHPRGCCDPEGSEAIRAALQAELKRRGLAPLARACTSGCLEQCELGPTVMVVRGGCDRPIWYGRVRVEDAARIVDQTLLAGQIIDELLIPDDWLNTRGMGPRGDGVDPRPARQRG